MAVRLDGGAPRQLAFADREGESGRPPDPSRPETTFLVSLHVRREGGTRMVVESRWGSLATKEELVAMAMVEGMTLALGQTHAIVSEPAPPTSG